MASVPTASVEVVVATMASVPTASVEVVHTAVSCEVSGTAVQPEIVTPFEVKLTLPVGAGGPRGPTVAVMVTTSPKVDGLGELVTVVVLGGGPVRRKTVPQPWRPVVHAGFAPNAVVP